MSRITTQSRLEVEQLVFAITSVSAATAAGRAHDDLDMAAVLAEYYALIAEGVRASEGRVVKVIGDGVLVVFPLRKAKEAVQALRNLQPQANALWADVDPRCSVQIKVGSGRLATGAMGPPGAERFDIYGTALNDLFKMPAGDFVVTPGLTARLG